MSKIFGQLEKDANEIIGIASTEDRDRHGEVIKQDGWDLKLYKKNPVLLLSHNYQELPIGKAENIRVEEGRLKFTARFSEATQKAREATQLVREGILNTFSVGFIVRDVDKKDGSIITKAELLEISLVAVPANPNAIVTAKGFTDNDLAKRLCKEWLIDEQKEEQPVKQDNSTADEDKKKVEVGEAGAKVDNSLDYDLRLFQKATGHLQEICSRLKKKGGAK